MWISVCSAHKEQPAPNCICCDLSYWVNSEDLENSFMAYKKDFVKWYQTTNATLKIPSDSAWQIWEQLTGQKRPQP